VYAVAQESLTNVLRHAHATVATVTVRPIVAAGRDSVEVTIVDDGRGAASGGAVSGTEAGGVAGMGIAGMRSRVEGLGGELTAGPAPGSGQSGFRVRAVLPVTAAGS